MVGAEARGMLLAFFHTKDAGPDSPCYRFHSWKRFLGDETIVMRREARRGPTGAIHTAVADGFPCSVLLITGISKPSSATSIPSSSFSPETM